MEYLVYAQLTAQQRRELCSRPASREQEVLARQQVAAIERELLADGAAALSRFSTRFDGVELRPEQFCIPPGLWREAWESLDSELQSALQTALQNIARFHRSELPHRSEPPVQTSPGVHCWREFRAIESVGLYIPGGSAPLFSTMLMLGVPAIIAGCRQIAFCSPPLNPRRIESVAPYDPERGAHAAAEMLGCMELLRRFAQAEARESDRKSNKSVASRLQYFQVGGAQAILGLAYGPDIASEQRFPLPAVAKIFGPGNCYVTEAKLRALRRVAIDMPAGPSEVLIIAEAGQDPEVLAADLLAQAEHGPSSQVLLLSPCGELLLRSEAAVLRQAEELPREVSRALEGSYLIETEDLDQALAFSNAYAPEHLILAVNDYEALLPRIVNAASVFCGPRASESFGDYASGTNHTLPTAGFARSHSGVNTQSFGRWLSFQSVSPEGLQQLGPTVELLAAREQLHAHRNAVAVRMRKRI